MPGDPAPEQEPKRVQDLYQDYATKRDRGERGQLPPTAAANPSTTPPSMSTVAATADAKPAAADGAAGDKSAAAKSASDKPKTGNTIYVSGNRLTEDFLHKHFDTFGKIVNISMEIEKGRGFITFQKTDSAELAIKELDSKGVGGVQLQVQLARRQPQIEPINDASSSATWSTLGECLCCVCGWVVERRRALTNVCGYFFCL